ncbi:uncharacterized protein LOC144709471 [Wolffia australiana]
MDAGAEEDQHRNPFLNASATRLQFRSEVSKACWDDKLGMGEIIEKKGGIWTSTGVTRCSGKLYCTIEEIIFYMERGALVLLDTDGDALDLKYTYTELAERGYGCNLKSLEVYRHLKSLGYIIRRHGVPWTMKREKSCSSESDRSLISGMDDENVRVMEEMIRKIEINGQKLDFDVYLPNSHFRKTSPGDPYFILSIISGKPPSSREVKELEDICKGVPLKFCHVDHGRVSIFSFEKSNLETLP